MLKTTLVLEDQSRQKNDQNVEVVRAVMAKDRRMSVRMIAEETGLDKTSKTGPASPNGHCRRLGAAPR